MRERYQPVETARRAQQTLSDLFGLVTSMPREGRGCKEQQY
jgi:hypothetical protein